MAVFIRDLVQYSGIETYHDEACLIHDTSSFKQSNMDLEFCVPQHKPAIEQIVKVDVTQQIYKTKLVKTPKGMSVEGQNLTGYKLMVLGDINLKIRYVAHKVEQSMHTFHADIPFCEYVVLSEDFCKLDTTSPQLYIEDVYISQRDWRCLFGNITMMLVVETY